VTVAATAALLLQMVINIYANSKAMSKQEAYAENSDLTPLRTAFREFVILTLRCLTRLILKLTEVIFMQPEKIQSFRIDHNKLKEGIYISRTDGDIVTYDLRTRRPNMGDYMDNVTMHTVEHMVATYIRSSEIGKDIIYFGPMEVRQNPNCSKKAHEKPHNFIVKVDVQN